MDEELIKLVKLYLERVKKDKLEDYSLKEEGYWVIIGGKNRYHGLRGVMAVVYGRFVDALAYAVQHPKFYDVGRKPDHPNNGYVVKIEPKKLEAMDGLEKLME